MIQCSFTRDFAMMGATPVQNLFLIEYMPKAPEGYAKVYLYGLMQCCCRLLDSADMALSLVMSEEEITAAYRYWQQQGLCRIVSDDPLCVEYLSAQAAAPVAAGGVRRYGELVRALGDAAGTRVFSPAELSKMYDWIEVFGFEEAAAVLLVRHCLEERGKKVSVKYMDAKAKAWAERGILTPQAAEEAIAQEKAASGGANRLLKRWNNRRLPTEDELALYEKWTREWGMDETALFAACANMTAANPNFKYLDSILASSRMNGGVSDYFRAQDAAAEAARMALERAGLRRAPTAQEKEQVGLWTGSWHMDVELILLAADYASSFSLPFGEIRRLVTDWHERGVGSLAAAQAELEEKRRQKENGTTRRGAGPAKAKNAALAYSQKRYTNEELSHIGIKLLDEEDD